MGDMRRTVRRERGPSVKEGMQRAMLQAKTSGVYAVTCKSLHAHQLSLLDGDIALRC